MSPTKPTSRSLAPQFANMAVIVAVAFLLATQNGATAHSIGDGSDASPQLLALARDAKVTVAEQLARNLNLHQADHPLSRRRLRRHRAGLHARRSLPRRQDSTDDGDEEVEDASDNDSTSKGELSASSFSEPERTLRASPTDIDTSITSTTTFTSTETSLVFSGSSLLTTRETITSTLEPAQTANATSSDWSQTFTATLTMGVNATSSTGKAGKGSTGRSEDDSSSEADDRSRTSSEIEPTLSSLLMPKIPIVTSGSLIRATRTADDDDVQSATSASPQKTSSGAKTTRITIDGVVWTIAPSSSTSSAEPSRITVDGVVWEDMSFMVPASLVEPIRISRSPGYPKSSPTPQVVDDGSEAHRALAKEVSSFIASSSRASAAPSRMVKRTVTATASAPPLLTGSRSAAANTATAAPDADDDCEEEEEEEDCDEDDGISSVSSNIKLVSSTSSKKASSSSSTPNAFPNVGGTAIPKPTTTTTSSKPTNTSSGTKTTSTSASTTSPKSTAAFNTFWDGFLALFKDLASGETTAKASVPAQTSKVWKTLNTAFGFSKRDELLEGEEWHVRDDEDEGIWFAREE